VTPAHLGWVGILRLGLVQTALGAIVVLTTSTLNRVMVVELALPAMVPGALVGLHYALQLLRPRMGHGSDLGGRSTPWIVGGMMVLAAGGTGAAAATAWMHDAPLPGLVAAGLAFMLVGLGVGAAGTSLLVLLAKRVSRERRAAAATAVWLMMIAGFAVTAGVAGHFLDPFSPLRLVQVSAAVSAIALAVTVLAVRGVEGRGHQPLGDGSAGSAPTAVPFRAALAEVWADPQARRFTIFVFVSMLAYSLQDLILEPFAGLVFGLTPGESTRLAGLQHGGVLAGMIAVAIACSGPRALRVGSLQGWIAAGCLASALALAGLVAGGLIGGSWPLRLNVALLGAANGAFAVAAIGLMMTLAGGEGNDTRQARAGLRMGLWGAAQAIAFGVGGFAGTVAADIARLLLHSPAHAYVAVFAIESALFLLSIRLAAAAVTGHGRSVRPDRAAASGALVSNMNRG
jgi:BCD family chlorophyll transporter-like MFS transporter